MNQPVHTANPTPLLIGMTGELEGQNYRVVGRSVIETQDRGTRCRWQEFHLGNAAGPAAILVYEVSGYGGQWQLFNRIEPQGSLTAAEAAALATHDQIYLAEHQLRITFKSTSRVLFSEGEVPEGYEAGVEDGFFDAGTDADEVVVSWRGEKVEWYRGHAVPYAVIRAAFGLRGPAPGSFSEEWSQEAPESRFLSMRIFAVIMAVVVVLLAAFWFWPSASSPVGRLVRVNPALKLLEPGSRMSFDGREFEVRAHGLVEIDQVGSRYQRYEYLLLASDGTTGLLVEGASPEGKEWLVYRCLPSQESLTPKQAAAKRVGETFWLEGEQVTITGMYREVLSSNEAAEAGPSGVPHFYYGFTGTAGASSILARWDEQGIRFFRGRLLTANEAPAGGKGPP